MSFQGASYYFVSKSCKTQLDFVNNKNEDSGGHHKTRCFQKRCETFKNFGKIHCLKSSVDLKCPSQNFVPCVRNYLGSQA